MVLHDTDSYRAYEAIPSHPQKSSAEDLERRKHLLSQGWQPHPALGPDFLVEPARPGRSGTTYIRRSVHIPT